MTTRDVVAELVSHLGTVYPTRLAEQSNRVGGAITVVVAPTSGEWEQTVCEPAPATVTAVILVVAAVTGEQGTDDLLAHLEPVAALARAVGWTPTEWEAAAVDDIPALRITATTQTEG